MGNAWSIAIETICGAFETEKRTFLAQPGKVTPLPRDVAAIQASDLQDKPSPDAPQTTLPVNKAAFLTHLKRKAHFFMLPKPIVKFAMESKLVSITETVPERPTAGSAEDAPDRTKPAAEAAYHTSTDPNVSPTVEMRIPFAADALAYVGHGLGSAFVEKEYAVLDLGYHEMTHAWLYLQAFADSDIQQLYTDGLAAYADPKAKSGNPPTPHNAFMEAAGYYVEDRVSRWLEAVGSLAKVFRDQELPRPVRPTKEDVELTLATIAKDYDEPGLLDVIVGGKLLVSPKLSDTNPKCQALRAAIDRKILDGRPLTKQRFMDVPQLAGLRQAALDKAKK